MSVRGQKICFPKDKIMTFSSFLVLHGYFSNWLEVEKTSYSKCRVVCFLFIPCVRCEYIKKLTKKKKVSSAASDISSLKKLHTFKALEQFIEEKKLTAECLEKKDFASLVALRSTGLFKHDTAVAAARLQVCRCKLTAVVCSGGFRDSVGLHFFHSFVLVAVVL